MWQRLFGRGSTRSRDQAKERLRLVLVHDRATVSPQLLDDMKEEIIRAISRHVEIDRSGTEMELSRRGGSMALVASIPIRRLRRGG